MAKRKVVDPREWTAEDFRVLIQHSDAVLEKCILQIFARQTADEQARDDTRWHNDIGFNGVDAELLSSFAKQLKRGKKLTEKQKHYGRKKMLKYSKQLATCARSPKTDKVIEFINQHKEIK